MLATMVSGQRSFSPSAFSLAHGAGFRERMQPRRRWFAAFRSGWATASDCMGRSCQAGLTLCCRTIRPWCSFTVASASGHGRGHSRFDSASRLEPCCQSMSVTIQLDLPEALVKAAKASGLLESRRLGDLLNEELRRERARKDLGRMLKELHSLPGEPMPPEEIQAEIDAVRARRRRRESGH